MADRSPSLPLFYKQPLPLDRRIHSRSGVPVRTDLSFAALTNSVPLMIGEFAEAARHYPILFTPGPEVLPIALLGLRGDENLFLDRQGEPEGFCQWRKETYIPAYVRRYPFILMETEDADRFALCVDALALASTSAGAATPLFTEAGDLNDLGQRASEFCQQYQGEIVRTRRFTKALADHNLLRDHQATIELPNGARFNLSGFQVIDGPAFDQLPDDVFLDWRRQGWLPAIHLHFAASANWRTLIQFTSRDPAIV